MTKLRTARIWVCLALAAVSLAMGTAARAANDSARFNGQWKVSFPYNGQTVTMVSIHEGGGYKNYVITPQGAVPAGSGTFSAANGKWTSNADKPNDSGTYSFTDNNTVLCKNAVGQSLLWVRDNTPLPPVVPPSPDQQAMEKYRKAADAGDYGAMYSVGWMYENGKGVPQDDQQAMVWFRKSAAGGNAAAEGEIGFFYGTGRGVPQDYRQAMIWYRKAADEGNAAAMRNIGVLYWYGYGVPVDQNVALYWSRKAAAAGDEQSKQWLRNNGFSESGPANGNGAPIGIRK